MPQVKIRIEKGVETAGDGREIQETKLSSMEFKKMAVVTAFGRQVANTGRQIINYSLSNVGQFTGNNLKQDEINWQLDMLGDVANVTSGIVTSIMTENPLPAIASITSIGIKYGTRAYSEYQEFRHAEYQSNLLRERSGNSTKNGSRGTEN